MAAQAPGSRLQASAAVDEEQPLLDQPLGCPIHPIHVNLLIPPQYGVWVQYRDITRGGFPPAFGELHSTNVEFLPERKWQQRVQGRPQHGVGGEEAGRHGYDQGSQRAGRSWLEGPRQAAPAVSAPPQVVQTTRGSCAPPAAPTSSLLRYWDVLRPRPGGRAGLTAARGTQATPTLRRAS
ncbi:unnamed protein product [Rangifer tarandus platyrhynchus]|uniref:Uncharacterized protein n=1 Tax=Rangifer tarandus platyrhynchus TaxID=3082113 RepID=A0AC59ZND9_RANTA